ncbi:alginate lyase family protein [Aureliella helgolandensis]|uniref:Alginate lyase n=1 Tax=Aureliella helgolandensis TaxID=2527968 RepID=A0A518G4W6_9BACT|nr:alginate lyase family protein [Aureliella helgolandensis]QDV23647.1 Alginate lyase [Aureliella helgolandensis]
MRSAIPLSTTLVAILLCTNLLPLGLTRGKADEPPVDFIHPGIAHTQAGIDFVKEKLASSSEPWAGAWEQLQASPYASLDWKPEPRAHVERGPSNKPNIGSSEFTQDGTAAYTLALRWTLSGDQRYAQKSAEILGAWARTLESISNHDARLLVGMDGQKYCNAAELLKHTWDGWPEEEQAQFSAMARKVWYPIIKDFYPSANGNWDASMLQTMIAMGIFLEDRTMFDRAVNYFLEGQGNGAISMYFNEFGECQESGRDQTHTQMGLEYLANSCEFAWNQGLDLYGAHDNRLLVGFEYTAKYNLGLDVPYEPYRSFEGRYHYKSISEKGRGSLRPMYEKVFNHYHHRSGLAAEFTEQAMLKVRERSLPRELESGNSRRDRQRGQGGRRRRSGGQSGLPWDTLMFNELSAPVAQAQ